MSLEGEVLRECKYGEVSNPAGNLFNRKLEKDGRTYTLLRHAGFEPGEILRDGEQIYKESKADCFWNGAYLLCKSIANIGCAIFSPLRGNRK